MPFFDDRLRCMAGGKRLKSNELREDGYVQFVIFGGFSSSCSYDSYSLYWPVSAAAGRGEEHR
jgi:hypothetical protein